MSCFPHPPDYLIQGVLAGNRRVLARTITLFESRNPDHLRLAAEVLQGLAPHGGNALRLGITGVPGVGKSTLIEGMGLHLVERGHRVAVLAVDPSSRLSRGSIMGDKTRMEELSRRTEAFVRPSPSGGTLGGVAARTREAMVACEAAGFDVILVETVGVGQSETAVKGMVDFFLLLMLAGAGDELQGIKRGIMELADVVAITKADGENREPAERARKAYENALGLFRLDRHVPVVTTSALDGEGLEYLLGSLFELYDADRASGTLFERRKKQQVAWFWELVEEGLMDRFRHAPMVASLMEETVAGVEKGDLFPGHAARNLLDRFAGQKR
ncbi:methylmalonyl Co-A mutase-associated GTPase MeaB [Desulfoluna spongiiphila]|uniref:Methylmalonyl-CoA mutase metallochaperone MeaB n=1 Tax=Desulfoluna spongiiphila TaxID=419481 RepID=A0A1G5HV13_9BACT|nr:methylmalonyl Co-A mutase-associated GTPase MeaB [Desulfoluna spongiiphila]SCY67692.1 methylmalonyl-CoA mutase metallochaperone MeaB [Desulfoluna spongiiphila]